MPLQPVPMSNLPIKEAQGSPLVLHTTPAPNARVLQGHWLMLRGVSWS